MIQEKEYEIVPTQEGILIFAIKPRENEPLSPFIAYDGGEHAKFYRRPNEIIVLDYINPEARSMLAKSPYAVMTEVDYEKEEVVRDYKVKIRMVEKLPLSDGMEVAPQR